MPGIESGIWLRGSSIVLADGAAVGTGDWDDESGHGKDSIQATAANKPAYRADALSSGKPGVEFDGTSDFLEFGTVADWKFLHDGTGCVFALRFIMPTDDGKLHILATTGVEAVGHIGIRWDIEDRGGSGNRRLNFYVYNGAAFAITLSTPDATVPVGEPTIAVVRYDPAGGDTCKIYHRGVDKATMAPGQVLSASDSYGPLRLGQRANAVDADLGGQVIHEAVAASGNPSDADLDRLHAYLRDEGGITLDWIRTIRDGDADNRYCAFPTAWISGGRWHTIYRDGADHPSVGKGKHVRQYSDDRGLTWSSPADVYDAVGVTVDVSELGTVLLSDGSVLHAMAVAQTLGTTAYEVQFTRSTDGGSTWSSPTAATTWGFGWGAAVCSPPIQKAGGSVLVVYHGRESNGGNLAVRCSVTADYGATFGAEVVVADDVGNRHLGEPWAVRLPNGHYLCTFHDEGELSAGVQKQLGVISTDEGATWGSPFAMFDGGDSPACVLVLASGLAVATHRDGTNGTVVYRTCSNITSGSSATWSAKTNLLRDSAAGFGGRHLWGALLEPSPGWVVFVGASDMSGGDASVYWCEIQEGDL